jgi:hypothetical protein
MKIWTPNNVNELQCLEEGDLVAFPGYCGMPSRIYEVAYYYLLYDDGGNSIIFTDLGLDEQEKYDLVNRIYRMASDGGAWPQADLPDITRLVKVLLVGGDTLAGHLEAVTGGRKDLQQGPFKLGYRVAKRAQTIAAEKAAKKAAKAAAEAAEEEARAARKAANEAILATMDPKVRAILQYFKRNGGAFGCQREHVLAVLGIILEKDLNGALVDLFEP